MRVRSHRAPPRRPHRSLLLVPLLLLAVGCATGGSTRRAARGYSERGQASWYGPGFHGRRTASGEIYDMYQLTAAHRTLPFGVVVEVRNRENGRTARVRINDRGPFVRGRIIDLSHAAARELRMLGPGVAPVEIRVVGGAVPSDSADYWVQAGAFRDPDRARVLYRRLRRDYRQVQISSDGYWHRVRLGPFAKRKHAERTEQELRRRGYEAFLVTS